MLPLNNEKMNNPPKKTSQLLNERRVSLWSAENVLELDRAVGCTTV